MYAKSLFYTFSHMSYILVLVQKYIPSIARNCNIVCFNTKKKKKNPNSNCCTTNGRHRHQYQKSRTIQYHTWMTLAPLPVTMLLHSIPFLCIHFLDFELFIFSFFPSYSKWIFHLKEIEKRVILSCINLYWKATSKSFSRFFNRSQFPSWILCNV